VDRRAFLVKNLQVVNLEKAIRWPFTEFPQGKCFLNNLESPFANLIHSIRENAIFHPDAFGSGTLLETLSTIPEKHRFEVRTFIKSSSTQYSTYSNINVNIISTL
jgi:hypothetical protein